MKKALLFSLVLILAVMSCQKEPKVINVTGVSINTSSIELRVGETSSLSVIVSPSDATNKNVIWSSSNTSVATVDNGKVTAVGGGKAIITVKTEDGGYSEACELTVIVQITGVSIDKSSLTLAESELENLVVTITPSDATNKNLIWSSSDDSVATVSDGQVSALKAGSVTITVKTEDGGFTSSCNLTVIESDYIDMGLSVKWAKCNLGASTPEEYGLFYQWGDTVGYGSDISDGKSFYWDSYKWCDGEAETLTKYNTDSSFGKVDDKKVLDMEDDAARESLGGSWRIPTSEEWAELIEYDNCVWKWTKMGSVWGCKVQSKKAGYTNNWIFLPAAGYRNRDNIYEVGTYGYYWSSSLLSYPIDANGVRFYLSGATSYGNFRSSGQSIRPVLKK